MRVWRWMVVCVPVFAAALLLGAEKPQNPRTAQLEKRQQELRLLLLKERANLLRSDAEIAELNYRKLDEALGKKDVIRKLQTELKDVETALQDQKGGGAPPPPAGP